MATDVSQAPTGPLPDGMSYDDRGLVARGVVARQMLRHRVEPRQGRTVHTCSFDYMAGNTMLAMHLAEIQLGGTKCDHRHLDETMGYIVSGAGYSVFRQDDDEDLIRVDWEAGDVLVVPTNTYHKHHNPSDQHKARQLSFRNTPLMRHLLHGGKGVYDIQDPLYHQNARFYTRFADQPDYFDVHEEIRPGLIRTNFIKNVVAEPLPDPDPDLGRGVAMQRYLMGGQRTLDVALIGIAPHGFVRGHNPLCEEAYLVLRGSGRTDLWNAAGVTRAVEWREGDVISPPLGVARQHVVDGDGEVRLLRVRNTALERAMGIEDNPKLDTVMPDRFPSMIEVVT
jgi:cupin superfamily acireductone dioxygenase involved in methionine salvage